MGNIWCNFLFSDERILTFIGINAIKILPLCTKSGLGPKNLNISLKEIRQM